MCLPFSKKEQADPCISICGICIGVGIGGGDIESGSSVRRELILIRRRNYGPSKCNGVPFPRAPAADFGGGNPCPPRPFAGAGVGLAVRLSAAEAETKLA